MIAHLIPTRRLFAIPFAAVAIASLMTTHPARAADKASTTVKVTAGQEFTITLEANHTTGFSWQLAKPLDETLVKSVKNDYKPTPQKAGGSPMTGVGGTETWTFKAVKSGKTPIEFKYVRPWEKDKEPAKTATYQIVME